MTGYWTLKEQQVNDCYGQECGAKLKKFLDRDDSKILYVGFGSMKKLGVMDQSSCKQLMEILVKCEF